MSSLQSNKRQKVSKRIKQLSTNIEMFILIIKINVLIVVLILDSIISIPAIAITNNMSNKAIGTILNL